MVSFYLKKTEELGSSELHDIFALRAEVFVVEQECIYQDKLVLYLHHLE